MILSTLLAVILAGDSNDGAASVDNERLFFLVGPNVHVGEVVLEEGGVAFEHGRLNVEVLQVPREVVVQFFLRLRGKEEQRHGNEQCQQS